MYQLAIGGTSHQVTNQKHDVNSSIFFLFFFSCELPYNPDRDMVLCEKCKEWYHCDCAGFNKNKNTKAAFICKRCESRPKKK